MAGSNTLILFGDGSQALFYGEKNVEYDRENVKVIPMLIVPSEELKERYGITEEDLPILTDDGRRGRWMNYPEREVKWLNKSLIGGAILIFCAFDGDRTNLMGYYDDLLEWCEKQSQTEARLRAHISSLYHEIDELATLTQELMRKNKEISEMSTAKAEEESLDEV